MTEMAEGMEKPSAKKRGRKKKTDEAAASKDQSDNDEPETVD